MESDSPTEADVGLNEYELDRDRRIARNMEALRKLGLRCTAADGLHTKLSSYKPTKTGPPLKRLKLQSTSESPPAPTRASKRLRGDAPLNAEEVKVAVEADEAVGFTKAGSRRGLALDLDGPPMYSPFTLRSIGTTIWNLGEIYRGPWAQRYWSNTGCLYHHAYPVGYHASKTQFGRTYHMKISAGPQGPLFSVSEEGSGRTYTGTSPTSPWTNVCVGLRTGQRISGPLFFGFSDPTTMRAIAAKYDPDELAAARQGQSMENRQPTAAEKAAKEFSSIRGIGQAVAMALSLTSALGGSQHEGLGPIRAWANASEENRAQLQNFLLESEEMPAATRKWPAWRHRIMPKVLYALCQGTEDASPTDTSEETVQGSQDLAVEIFEVPGGPEAAPSSGIAGAGRSGKKAGHRADKQNGGSFAQPARQKPLGWGSVAVAGAEGRKGSGRQRRANSKFADFVQ